MQKMTKKIYGGVSVWRFFGFFWFFEKFGKEKKGGGGGGGKKIGEKFMGRKKKKFKIKMKIIVWMFLVALMIFDV